MSNNDSTAPARRTRLLEDADRDAMTITALARTVCRIATSGENGPGAMDELFALGAAIKRLAGGLEGDLEQAQTAMERWQRIGAQPDG